jgi:ribosomal protein S18 acetylase RimI-like enzyme
MPLNVHVRVALPSDAKRIAVLAMQVWLHTYAIEGITQEISDYTRTQLTPENYLAVIHDASCNLWVAESGSALLGFALVKFGASCPENNTASAELQTLYVQEHFVGQGIGKLLLQTAESMARSRSLSPLWLTVNVHNSNAIAFYTRQNYMKVGTTYFALGERRHENHILIGSEA